MSSDASALEYQPWAQFSWLARGLDWLSRHERQVLAFGVLFQVAVLITMMIRPMLTLATGDTILLRVVPVDPRDLFRGDYVILSYEISRPGWNAMNPSPGNWERMRQLEGKTVFVQLEPEDDGKHWKSSGFQLEPATEGKFIRGTVMGGGRVQYGIEQFFVQEGTGHDYEKAVREHKLSAEVVVDAAGNAQIKALVIEP